MRRTLAFILCGALGLALLPSAPARAAGDPVMVKDVSAGSASSMSSLGSDAFTDVAGTAFFAADDGIHGWELWKSDGTDAGTRMVKDIWPGPDGSAPSFMVAAGGTLFFAADDGTHGRELWKSDGTEAGTVLVADINPGPSSSWGYGSVPMAAVGNTVFFAADDGIHGFEPWRSDGTALGTMLLLDINPGPTPSNPDELTAVGNSVFFRGTNDGIGGRLWKADVTLPGAVPILGAQVAGLSYPCGKYGCQPVPSGAWIGMTFPHALTAVGNELFFAAGEPTHGVELWKSDGTEAGTVMVKDINPGQWDGLNSDWTTTARTMVNAGGTLFFAANDGVHGSQLWRSDGTDAGTFMLPAAGGVGDLYPQFRAPVGGTLYFGGSDGSGHASLWKSDGTVAGTVMVKVFSPGTGPFKFEGLGGSLYFSGANNASDDALWTSDGTDAGTVVVQDIGPSADIGNLTAVGSKLFFTANDGVHGYEPWVYSP